MAAFEFRVLGPLLLARDGDECRVPTIMLRRLVGMLLARPGMPISADSLIDGMWMGQPPPSSRRSLTTYVYRLRALVGDPTRIDTAAGTYTLLLQPDELDATQFRTYLAEAALARERGDPGGAREALRRSLGLWRGPAFTGLCDIDPIGNQAQILEQLRVGAFEDWADLELDAGGHGAVLQAVGPMITDHPYRERLRGQLMIALYRSGRQVDALTAYTEVYRLLADELGVQPTPELTELHERILRGDARLVAVAAPAVTERSAPHTLPPDVVRFVGRTDDLRWLDGNADAPGTVILNALSGTAGVGKTALAVRWAYASAARFPDGLLYVDLRGHGAIEPMTTLEALSHLLRTMGMSAEEIPHTEHERSALLRSTLAATRCLLVLDNAASAQQVRPLLPGGGGNLVIVTSRNTLSGLIALDGARRLTLGVLPDEDALALLASLVADRVTADPPAAAELAGLCGNLPLAIRIAAAHLLDHPTMSIAIYLAELRSADLITALTVADDPSADIATVFGFSYGHLDATRQRLFRLLGASPVLDVTADTAAAIAGLAPATASETLHRLVEANLVIQRGDRYAMHDLIREYARGLDAASGSPLGAAELERLCHYYRDRASHAAFTLGPDLTRLPAATGYPEPCDRFTDAAQALAWLDTERTNIVAIVRRAAAAGLAPITWEFADILRNYFAIRRHMPDWLCISELAVRAATEAGDLAGQAAARLSNSQALWWLGRRAEAVEVLLPAVDLAEAASWYAGTLACLSNLGAIHGEWGRHDDAIRYMMAVDESYQRHGECAIVAASNCSNLSAVLHQVGRAEEGLRYNRQALAMYSTLGVDHGTAVATANLADKLLFVGDPAEVDALLTDALAMFGRLGDQYGEATVLTTRASLYNETDRTAQARATALEAVRVAKECGAARRIAAALTALAVAERAPLTHAQALEFAIGDAFATSQGLTAMGRTLGRLGRQAEAIEACEYAEAVAINERMPVLAGQALTVSAEISLADGRFDAAQRSAREALTTHQDVWYAARAQAVLDTLASRQLATAPIP